MSKGVGQVLIPEECSRLKSFRVSVGAGAGGKRICDPLETGERSLHLIDSIHDEDERAGHDNQYQSDDDTMTIPT